MSGDDVMVNGNPTGRGPESTRGRQEADGLQNQSIVPYQQVLADYMRTAARAIERAGYPIRLRSTVQDYFNRLGGPQ